MVTLSLDNQFFLSRKAIYDEYLESESVCFCVRVCWYLYVCVSVSHVSVAICNCMNVCKCVCVCGGVYASV